MPAKSPEAMSKKRATRQSRRWRQRKPVEIVLPAHKIAARRMMPRLPESTAKADLRAMLSAVVKNT